MSDRLTLEGSEYIIGKLDVFQQFHCAKRLAPLLAGAASISGMVDGEFKLDSLFPLLDGIAKLPDDDLDYVLTTCLLAVRRIDHGQSVKVITGKAMQYQDMSGLTVLTLVKEVLMENMSGFFPSAGPKSPDPAKQ